MKAAALIKDEQVEEIRIEQLALDDAGGDPEKAVELLTDRILEQPDIIQAHVRDWARAWAHGKVHDLLSTKRASIILAVSNNSGNFANSLAVAMKNERDRMMDMPLFGGKRLADATPEEVRESSRRYSALASDTARKARWQSMVADAAEAKGGGIIGKALTEKALTQLWEKSDV